MAACISSLEAELTAALEDTAQLEERNTQLSQQLSEKVRTRPWMHAWHWHREKIFIYIINSLNDPVDKHLLLISSQEGWRHRNNVCSTEVFWFIKIILNSFCDCNPSCL